MRVTVDTIEPWPHPWGEYLPEGWHLERETLETDDFALSTLPEGAVVERKTPGDLIGCMTAGRDRFEPELVRSRYVGRFVVVVEGSLEDVLRAARGMSANSLVGTLAAWQRRYSGFFFAGDIGLRRSSLFAFLAGRWRKFSDTPANWRKRHEKRNW